MAYAPEVAIDAGPVFPLGPAQVDYYRVVQAAQGSMGIVTWVSVGCEVLPQLQKLFFVPSQRLEDLVGFAHRLLKFRYGDEFLILNNSALAYILDEGGDQSGALRGELPPWVLILVAAGYEYLPEERVEVQEKDIMDIAQQFSLKLVSAIPGASSGEVLEILRQPSKEPYWKLRYRGGCQDIFFLTTLNRTPEFVNTMSSVAQQQGYSPSQIGVYIQPQHQGVCCHCEFSLPFDPGNPKEATSTQELFTKASGVLINQGAYFSRPYGPWANAVYNRDANSTIILKKIKGIFDPNNVMNPGKLCF
jgi:FAD/FMN-containing dehydrogenase